MANHSIKIKELTEEEFKSTFSEKMHSIKDDAKIINDEWEYVLLLDKAKYYLNEHIITNRIIENVYRNSIKTYDQILIPTQEKNIFLIIIIHLKNKNIFGHYLLNLNKEYGID
jgi:hypothetical protein